VSYEKAESRLVEMLWVLEKSVSLAHMSSMTAHVNYPIRNSLFSCLHVSSSASRAATERPPAAVVDDRKGAASGPGEACSLREQSCVEP
jgi:hypothetical protein